LTYVYKYYRLVTTVISDYSLQFILAF
jgi:hypothetical protein